MKQLLFILPALLFTSLTLADNGTCVGVVPDDPGHQAYGFQIMTGVGSSIAASDKLTVNIMESKGGYLNSPLGQIEVTYVSGLNNKLQFDSGDGRLSISIDVSGNGDLRNAPFYDPTTVTLNWNSAQVSGSYVSLIMNPTQPGFNQTVLGLLSPCSFQ